jgi:hypothetical protein
MSRRQWVWAAGLLKVARVLGDQVTSAETFLIDDVGECAEAIERAVGPSGGSDAAPVKPGGKISGCQLLDVVGEVSWWV